MPFCLSLYKLTWTQTTDADTRGRLIEHSLTSHQTHYRSYRGRRLTGMRQVCECGRSVPWKRNVRETGRLGGLYGVTTKDARRVWYVVGQFCERATPSTIRRTTCERRFLWFTLGQRYALWLWRTWCLAAFIAGLFYSTATQIDHTASMQIKLEISPTRLLNQRSSFLLFFTCASAMLREAGYFFWWR